MKVFIKATIIPFVAAFLGCVLFFLVALIPQDAIYENAAESARQIAYTEGWMPSLLNRGRHQHTDYQQAYLNDNYTDMLILMESYNLTIAERSSILTNPLHGTASEYATNALEERVIEGAPNSGYYVRYWMGFRVFIRLLFLLIPYNRIRVLISLIWFVLFVILLLIISKKCSSLTAFCFAAAIILVNPAIVSHSLQFSCVFLLTFLFSIYICLYRYRHMRFEYLFCLFGVLTQYFDFYTTPIMTWAFPLIFLLLTDDQTSQSVSVVAKSLVFWGFGYGLMWIVKLALVTLMTSINGFKDGFTSFLWRMSITSRDKEPDATPGEALHSVWNTVFPGRIGQMILLVGILLLVVAMLIFLFCRGREVLKRNSLLLLIACVPFIWYCAAAQPTAFHAWFQYRSISVVFFSFFLFIANAFVPYVSFLKGSRTIWTG